MKSIFGFFKKKKSQTQEDRDLDKYGDMISYSADGKLYIPTNDKQKKKCL